MAKLAWRNTRLGDRDLHGVARTVAVFGARGDVVSVRGRAVTDQLGERLRAARQCVAQLFDDKDASAFAHDKAVARRVEGARGLSRGFVEAGRKRTSSRKATKTDDIHACFSPTAHSDVSFVGADDTSRIADRLDAGRARRHGRAERAFEAVPD